MRAILQQVYVVKSGERSQHRFLINLVYISYTISYTYLDSFRYQNHANIKRNERNDFNSHCNLLFIVLQPPYLISELEH